MLAKPIPPRAAREPSQGSPNQIKQTARRKSPAQAILRGSFSAITIPQLGQAPHDLRKPKRQLIGIVVSHAGQIGLNGGIIGLG